MGRPRIAVIGGTGALGGALAARFARFGFDVALGSRTPDKADQMAKTLALETGAKVVGFGNLAAAERGDVVIVTVPFANQTETIRAVAPALKEKIVVDATVPLIPPKVSLVQLPQGGSAALMAAALLSPEVKLVSAFHNVSAHKLRGPGPVDCDILVFGDDAKVRGAVVELIADIGLRGIHGGPLANSAAAEAMTSVLISINRRYKLTEGAGIRITGISETNEGAA